MVEPEPLQETVSLTRDGPSPRTLEAWIALTKSSTVRIRETSTSREAALSPFISLWGMVKRLGGD